MILIAVHERKASPDVPEEHLSRIALDPSSTAEGGSGVRYQEQCKGQGTVTGQSPEVLAERASEGDRLGQDAPDTAHSRRHGSECWDPRQHCRLS